jgi:hypothetical protein
VLFGLDISHHQDERLDLGRAKREGISYVILKATEGSTWTDPEFADNLAEARAAGLLVAAYHYQRPGSAAAQVANVKAVVPRDVPVILDVEDGSGDVDLTRTLVARLRAAGYRTPLLYLPRWYWDTLGRPSLEGLPPLWSSRYPDMVVGSLADEWADVPGHYWNGYGGLDVELLQFTSSTRIAGHQPIDANAYRGSLADLAALLGSNTGGGGAAPGQEDDMPYSAHELETFAYRGFRNFLKEQPDEVADALVKAGLPEIVWKGILLTDRSNGSRQHPETHLASLRDRLGYDHFDPIKKQLDQLAALMAQRAGYTVDELADAMVPRLSAALLPSLGDAMRTVLGEDNKDQAAEVVAELGRIIAAADTEKEGSTA